MKVLRSLEELPHGFPQPIATIGNFDGVHLGHQSLMRYLAGRAAAVDGTSTVVTFSPHPLAVLAPNHAPRQIQTLEQKLATLEALGIELVIVIPFTTEFAQTRAADFATRILADRIGVHEVHVGPNFAFGYRREGSFNLLKEIGDARGFLVGKVPQVQFRGSRVSSTAVRQALVAGQVTLARRLLGRPYALAGEIVHGDAIGAGLSVPTANLQTSNELIPRSGVYVTLLVVDGRRRRAVTNVGVRPTISGGAPDSPLRIETHVLDFKGSLYGRQLSLEFLVRLRDERRFPGRDALLAQIRRDIARANRYFDWLERVAPALLAEGAGVA
jgi:riboflavin kinase/FMN adenylyltransferase